MLKQLKDTVLNGMLVLLVGLSVILSARVWFPPDRTEELHSRDPRVQAAPPTFARTMPDIFRPERITVRTESGRVAVLPAESDAYRRALPGVQGVLSSIRIAAGPTPVEEATLAPDSITLSLPVALTLGEWVDRWGWITSSLRSPSIKIDRVIFSLGPGASVYLSGPHGGLYWVGALTAAEQEKLQEMAAAVDPTYFTTHRPLVTKGLTTRVVPGLLVPATTTVPQGKIKILKPDEKVEEARYFPDLSVIRQIDERDARAFTDGQRFLRITTAGVLEFRSANLSGMVSPELSRALATVQDWVNNRGGWSSELVLNHYVQQPGRTRLVFSVRGRGPGPYPVESEQGALQIEVAADRSDTSAQRVVYLKRLPEFWATFDDAARTPVISPEEAVRQAIEAYPRHLIFDVVRDMHLAYHVKLGQGWVLEPVWVLQVGEARLYVPALRESAEQP